MANTRETVTYETVAEAIGAIEEAGEKATLRRVQVQVGRGSHTTLLAHIRRYRDTRHADATKALDNGTLTDPVRLALGTWVQEREAAAKHDAETRAAEIDELYRAAQAGWEQADARIEEVEQNLVTARAIALEHEQEASHKIAVLQARIEEADKKVATLQQQVAHEQQHAEASRVATAEWKIKAEAQAESLKTVGKENDELRAETRNQAKAMAAAEQRAAVAEERAKNRQEQLADVRQTLEQRAQAVDGLQSRLSQNEKQLSVVERELAVCRAEYGIESGGQRVGAAGQGGHQDGPKPRARAEKTDDEGG